MTRSAGQQFVDDVTARTPLQRLGDPTEVGDVLSFLVGAAFVTGEEIVIDGGIGLVGG
jgi:3-oxoacyl-[acyl-carrier protein] reductase